MDAETIWSIVIAVCLSVGFLVVQTLKRMFEERVEDALETQRWELRDRAQQPVGILTMARDVTPAEAEDIRRRFQKAADAGFDYRTIAALGEGMKVAQQQSWADDEEADVQVYTGESEEPLRRFRADGSEVLPTPTPEQLRRQGEDVHNNIIDLGVTAAADYTRDRDVP